MWGGVVSNNEDNANISLSQKALQIAITQIGQEEKPRGSNWGEPVQTYLHTVDISFPASWCMAFVYWCFEQAAEQLKVPNPMFKTGGVLYQYNKSKTLYLVNDNPQTGDVFIMDFGNGTGHTGIVETFDDLKKIIHTIEGNTNDTGSREGYEVCRRQRSVSLIKAFLRFN